MQHGLFPFVCRVCRVCMCACVSCVHVCMCVVCACVCVCCALHHSVTCGKLCLSQDTEDEQHTAAAVAQGAVDQKTRLARITSNPEFTPEAQAHPPRVQERDDTLLAADYTPAIYKDKFRLLINLEEKEHEEALKR